MDSTPLMFAEEDVEGGGREGKNIQDDFAYKNNVAQAEVRIRLAFIRKVYSMLSVQLLATVCIGAVFNLVQPIKQFVVNNPWIMLMAFVLSFISLISLLIYRRRTPHNLILLAAFTIVQSFMIGVVTSFSDQHVVLQAIGTTFAVVTGITLYTFNTKRDFSFMGYGLFAGLTTLIVAGFLQIFIQSTALELIISVMGAILFSLFILYDTQQLMTTVSPEEYVLATINLYLDIINLFLEILRILEVFNRN